MPSLIGNRANQVSTNGDLGTLAFQDSNAVTITGGVASLNSLSNTGTTTGVDGSFSGKLFGERVRVGIASTTNDAVGTSTTLQFSNGPTSFISGNVDAYAYKTPSAIGSIGAHSLIFQVRPNGVAGYSFVGGSSNTSLLNIAGSGNVGIANTVADTLNTANGAANLAVGSGSGNEGITIYTGSSNTGSICFADGTTTTTTYAGYINYLHASDAMTFGTGAAERMRITSAGDIETKGGTVYLGASNTGSMYVSPSTGHLYVEQPTSKAVIFRSQAGIESFRGYGTVLALSGASTGANGTGIVFPATQSASSDANTLDDYEEGTWTPNQGGGLTVVGTFASSGKYTKIGNLVTVVGTLSATTSIACTNASVILSNLPFLSASAGTGTSVSYTISSTSGLIASSTSVYSSAIAATAGIYFSLSYQV